jgi:hypothetical protein
MSPVGATAAWNYERIVTEFNAFRSMQVVKGLEIYQQRLPTDIWEILDS